MERAKYSIEDIEIWERIYEHTKENYEPNDDKSIK